MSDVGYRCRCCRLLHTDAAEGLCLTCRYHQSSEIHQTAKRHQEHEEMLRARLGAASEWARNADSERKAFGEKMHFAYKSRDRAIKALRRINDHHELRSDGRCKCGVPKNCKIATVLDDRGIQTLIRRVDEFEDNARRREELWRELQAADPFYGEDLHEREEYDQLVRFVDGPRATRGRETG